MLKRMRLAVTDVGEKRFIKRPFHQPNHVSIVRQHQWMVYAILITNHFALLVSAAKPASFVYGYHQRSHLLHGNLPSSGSGQISPIRFDLGIVNDTPFARTHTNTTASVPGCPMHVFVLLLAKKSRKGLTKPEDSHLLAHCLKEVQLCVSAPAPSSISAVLLRS
ncbi:hypothetical protein PSPO01_14625 [Paraphaeosphaeria sporulosa]